MDAALLQTVGGQITIEEAARDEWDVLVMGAGPAGALAARGLAMAGRRVLLVDRSTFPRFKVCGGCLSDSSMRTLDRVGLGDLPSRLGGHAIKQMTWAAGGLSAHVGLPGGVSISRGTFDTGLVAAAIDAGVTFLPAVTATLAESDTASCHVSLTDDNTEAAARAKVVIVATGLGSKLLQGEDEFHEQVSRRSHIGIGALMDHSSREYQPGVIYMACGDGGYVGLVRVEDDKLNVAAALSPAFIKESGGPGSAADSIVRQAGLPAVEPLAEIGWRGTLPLTRSRDELYRERVFVVGDAAGYVEPFTGEGMAWGMASASALVSIADSACDAWYEKLGQAWASTHRQLVRRRQGLCRSLAWLLRHPRLTRGVVRLVAGCPSLARPFVASLNGSQTHAVAT